MITKPFTFLLITFLLITTLLLTTFPILTLADEPNVLQMSIVASQIGEDNIIIKFSGHINCGSLACIPQDTITFNALYAPIHPKNLPPFESMKIVLYAIPVESTTGSYQQYPLTLNFPIEQDPPKQVLDFAVPVTTNRLMPFDGELIFSKKSYDPTKYGDLNFVWSQPGLLSYVKGVEPFDFHQLEVKIIRSRAISPYLVPLDDTLPVIPDNERIARSHVYTNFTMNIAENMGYLSIFIPPTATQARTLEIMFSSPIQSLLPLLKSDAQVSCFLNGRPIRTKPMTFVSPLDGLFLSYPAQNFEQHTSMALSCPIPFIHLTPLQSNKLGERIPPIYVQLALSNRTSIKQDPDWLPEWSTMTQLYDYSQNTWTPEQIQQPQEGKTTTTTTNQNQQIDETNNLSNNTPYYNTNDNSSPHRPIIPRYNHVFGSGSDSSGDSIATCSFSLSFSEQIPFNFIPVNTTHFKLDPVSFHVRLRGVSALGSGDNQWLVPGSEELEHRAHSAPIGLIYFSQQATPEGWLDSGDTTISRFAMTPVNNTYFDLTFPIINQFYEKDKGLKVSGSSGDDLHPPTDNIPDGSSDETPDQPFNILGINDNIYKNDEFRGLQYISNDTITITIHTLLKKPNNKSRPYFNQQCLLRFNNPVPLPNGEFNVDNNNIEYVRDLILDGQDEQQEQQQQHTTQTITHTDDLDFATTQITNEPEPAIIKYPIAPSIIASNWNYQPMISDSFTIDFEQINQTSTTFNISLPRIAQDVTYIMMNLESYTDWYFSGNYTNCYVNGQKFSAENNFGYSSGNTTTLYIPLADMSGSYPIPYGSQLHVSCDDTVLMLNTTSFERFPNQLPSIIGQQQTTKAPKNGKFDPSNAFKIPLVFKLIVSSPAGVRRQLGMIVFPILKPGGYVSPGQFIAIIIMLFIITAAWLMAFPIHFCFRTYTGCFCFGSRAEVLETHQQLHEYEMGLRPELYEVDGTLKDSRSLTSPSSTSPYLPSNLDSITPDINLLPVPEDGGDYAQPPTETSKMIEKGGDSDL